MARIGWYQRMQLEHPWLWGMLFGAIVALVMGLPTLLERDPPKLSNLIVMALVTTTLVGGIAGLIRSTVNRRNADR